MSVETQAIAARPVPEQVLLSGNEAIALAALHAGVALGSGYPGTPSTDILERFSELGGRAQWAPNEKVALEVGIGVAFTGARALVTMKHVGVNVAADAFFSVAYTGVTGAFVIVSADDPGMHSSQNEQDNRRYAVMAGMPTLEPADSQEAYDFFLEGVRLSEKWKQPFMLRLTTRICHSMSIVRPSADIDAPMQPRFESNIPSRVMVPAHARPAHRRLRAKLAEIQAWSETSGLHEEIYADPALGIVTSGAAFMHACEAAPGASFLKLGLTYPLPIERIRRFAQRVQRLLVIEEGDPYLVESLRTAGIPVEDKPEMYRFGELNVPRVARIVAGDTSPEPVPPRGKPPQLCAGCPHRMAFAVIHRLNCIVSGDIGCYTLAALPPFGAMDTQLCMGASVGIGLGMRHCLPREDARRVISVIGDSTFMHSGLTGLAEMVYNPPETGHVLVILDNGTTAMTGLQENPGTGRRLDHTPTARIAFEAVARAMGVPEVHVAESPSQFEQALRTSLDSGKLAVVVLRYPCRLARPRIEAYQRAAEAAHA